MTQVQHGLGGLPVWPRIKGMYTKDDTLAKTQTNTNNNNKKV